MGVHSSLLTLSSLVLPGPEAAPSHTLSSLNSLQEAARTTGQTLPPGATLNHLPLNHAVGRGRSALISHGSLSQGHSWHYLLSC